MCVHFLDPFPTHSPPRPPPTFTFLYARRARVDSSQCKSLVAHDNANDYRFHPAFWGLRCILCHSLAGCCCCCHPTSCSSSSSTQANKPVQSLRGRCSNNTGVCFYFFLILWCALLFCWSARFLERS